MAELESNFEATQQAPIPEFYVFTSPDGTIERYTSFSRNLTFQGQTFYAATIKRGRIKHDRKFSEVKITLSTPITPNIALYVPNTPIQPVEIIIYRSHLDYLTQYEVFFKGSIKNVQFKDKIASATCISSNKYFGIKLPTVIYQSFCNHDIYDSSCGIDRNYAIGGITQYKRTATITDITESGKKIWFTQTSGASYSTGQFMGGEVITPYTDRRLITTHDLNTVNIHVPFDSRLQIGDEIVLYPGCDGSPATCKNTFNNLFGPGGTAESPNIGKGFLGMPYIPSRNPAIWGFK